MGDLIFLIALGLEALLAGWAVFETLREQAALRRCIEVCSEPESAEPAAKRLRGPQGVIAAEMLESVRLRSTLDEALVKAVTRASEQPWGASPAVQAGVQLATVAVVLAPASLVLLKAAHALGFQSAQLSGLHASARYVAAPLALQSTFHGLRAGFSQTALLLAGLSAVWALTWWLRRPEAREARFVRALLLMATRIRPGTSAPVAGRLAQLIAPQQAMHRPIAASLLWFLAISLAWSVLYFTAPVRAANHVEPRYRVWPKEGRAAITLGADLKPPTVHGGQPFVDRAMPTITVSPQQVLFQGRAFAAIEDGALGAGWPPTAIDSIRDVLNKGTAVTVLAHEAVSATQTILPLMRWLHATAGVKDFHLLVLRELPDGAAQADLHMAVREPSDAPGLTLVVEAEQVAVGQIRIPNRRPGWRQDVRVAVRRIDELTRAEARRPVLVELQGEVGFEQMASSLGAADDSCSGDLDCGLPGLDLRLVFDAK